MNVPSLPEGTVHTCHIKLATKLTLLSECTSRMAYSPAGLQPLLVQGWHRRLP